MSFTFHCPYCNSKFESEDEWIGQDAQCPTCQKEIVICSCEDEDQEELDKNFKEYPNLSIFQRIKLLLEKQKLHLGIQLLKREKLKQQERLELEIMYYFRKNDFKKACNLAELYISIFPKSAIGYRWMAEILDDGFDQKKKSLEYSTKAISIDEKYAECYRIRGNTKRWMRPADNRGAIKDYQCALQLEPKSSEAYSGLAFALEAEGHPEEEVLQYLKKSIQYDIYRTNFAPRQGLALIYNSQGRTDEALKLIEEAIEISGREEWYLYSTRASFLYNSSSQHPWEEILKDLARTIVAVPLIRQLNDGRLRDLANAAISILNSRH